VLQAVCQGSWFHQDGALAHNTQDVRKWLFATYPGRLIDFRGPIAWPNLLPGLIPIVSSCGIF
jgi:hypothetical protein